MHTPPTNVAVPGGFPPEQPFRRDDERSPDVQRAWSAFRRDLPDLLRNHAREWVAYCGDECLGFSHSKALLYQECLRRGLSLGSFLVLSVEPDVPRVADGVPDI